ncbi:MAG: helix-turn-helix transcriptional regulator, partial [Dehalococcoidia bacterium]|nr:helix-turn-helix transcriptional regulator [Dehalococcoidia bacterium]
MADGELSLTEREERILELIGQGKADVEVANDLAISFDEAKRGVQSVMRKLGVSTREEAAAKGKRGGRRWLPRMDGLVHWVGDTPSGQA